MGMVLVLKSAIIIKRKGGQRATFFALILKQLLDALSVAEGIAHAAFHHVVAVTRGIIANRGKLFNGEFSVLIKHGLVGSDVHNFAEQEFRFFVVAHELAFKRERQFSNKRGIDIFAFDGCKASLCKFISHAITTGNAQIVDSLDVISSRHAHGKSLASKNVRDGLVGLGHVNCNLVVVADRTPSGHHGVRRAVIIISGNDNYKILTTVKIDSCAVQLVKLQ